MELSETAIALLVAELIELRKTKDQIRAEVQKLRRDNGIEPIDGPIPLLDGEYERPLGSET